ncbi:hypothetical protein [Brevibacterium zhoupengii]|uniref:hypothetical protein n=1 Tax=Brevibacterium zhoupengii TaxID=2898795 RepID=UPI001F0924BC|nr:hypothetical protein [Brevibacterium zhoupengii]
MAAIDAPPELWIDWCSVTGALVALRDARFTQQVCPSQAVLNTLCTVIKVKSPAWPTALREDLSALHQLLRSGANLSRGTSAPWLTRLKAGRLIFVVILVGPEAHGGFGLTRY